MKWGYLACAILLTIFGLVALLPPRKLAIDLECHPVGPTYRLKALVQRERFWRGQIGYLDSEIAWFVSLPDRIVEAHHELDKVLQKERAHREELYRQFPKLRPSAAEQSASKLREQAEALERSESQARDAQMREEIVRKLQACRALVSSRGMD